MQAFEYAHPRSMTEALPLLGSRWGETEILAGGTDLLSLMKNYVVTPKRVVNIKGLRELRGIRGTPEGIYIGALVTLEERSEEHTSELQSRGHLVCRLLLEKKKQGARCRRRPASPARHGARGAPRGVRARIA